MNILRMKAAVTIRLGSIFLLVYLALPALAAPIPEGNGHQEVDLGGIRLEVLTYRPKRCTPSALLLVFHGLHRNVDSYRDDLRPLANELCMLELVPLFDEQRFPSWRYQKGGIAYQGNVLPPNQWTGNLAIKLVDWAREQEGQPHLPYVLVGHSAGAQFLSRVAAFIPNQAVAIVIANPSTHVLPSLDVDAPFGFAGAYEKHEAETAMRNYLAQPVIMVLGKDDVGDKDRDDEPAALQQGKTRYERGMNTFRSAQTAAAAHNWRFQWKLVELSNVGHSAGDVFNSQPVKAAIRSALASQASTTTALR